MLSHKLGTLAFLMLLGILFAAGNLWVAAARSTIPLALSDRVARKETRREKHPGRDDVHFLYLESGRVLHVDAEIFKAVAAGDLLEKAAWSRELRHGTDTLPLVWSADFVGMTWCMPIAMCVVMASSFYVLLSGPSRGAPPVVHSPHGQR